MTPIEHYWPPEMLAEVFPEECGHLVLKWCSHSLPRRSRLPHRDTPSTISRVDAWSSGGQAGSRHGG
jgi:hypothetical protein